jgi:hypothetical protein
MDYTEFFDMRSALERMPIRKRPPSAILQDIIPSIDSLVEVCSPHLTDGQAIEILDHLVSLSYSVKYWVASGENVDNDESQRCFVSPS